MIYIWTCQECGCQIEVERRVDQIELGPEIGRCPDCLTISPNWKRIIVNDTQHIRADGWGRKGEWNS